MSMIYTSMISDSSWDQSTGLWPTQDCLFDDDDDDGDGGDGDDDDDVNFMVNC